MDPFPTEIPCPACKKISPLTQAKCGRCQCDLTALIRVAHTAESRHRMALVSLINDDPAEAMELAEISWRLWHQPQTATLGALAAVRAQDVPSILMWQERASS